MSKFAKDFKQFISYFPKVERPLTLSTSVNHVFSKKNKPLPEHLINQFILPYENIDEYTEFVPCLILESTDEYLAIIYWKASLMQYEYILVTYNKFGNLIARKVIAGRKSDGKTILERVTSIDEDGTIHVVEGKGDLINKYNAQTSQSYHIEILQSGDILQMLNES